MATGALGLGFVFTARDAASPAIARLGRNFGVMDRLTGRFSSGLRTSLTRTRTAGLALAAVGGLGVAAAAGLARASGDFEMGLARVGGVTRATTSELASLRDRAIQVGIETSFSPDQGVEGLYNLATMGFNASEAMALIGPSTALAEGGMIGLDAASRAVAAATRVFSLSMEEAGGSADRLLRITQLTALQATDLDSALGGVARGAGQTRQNLDEMLISMGLVRNTGVDASVAASSVSSALQFMSRNSRNFASDLGVSVTNADGSFRDFLDVVLESSEALNTRFTNAAERSTASMELFGRFGITAYNAVSNQLTAGVRNASGEIVRGAEAVAYLRSQMRGAAGTAREFQQRLLGTFPGQLILLRGSVQTLAVVLGENFARAFRPFVEGTIRLVNTLIERWNALPVEVRDGIARAFVVGSALLSLFGAFVASAAGLGLVALAFKAIAIGAISIAAGMAPIVAVFGLGVLAIFAFRKAAEGNIGGVGDFVRRTSERISLTWNALRDLFTRGGFSGAVFSDLRRAENAGIRTFVITIYGAVHRIQKLWEGLVRGFDAGMESLGPSWRALTDAFDRLGAAFGFGSTNAEELGRSLPTSRFERFGERVGSAITWVVDLLVGATTWILNFATAAILVGRYVSDALDLSGVGGQLREIWGRIQDIVRGLFGVGAALGIVDSQFGQASVNGSAAMGMIGTALSWTLDLLVQALGHMATFISMLERAARVARAVWNVLPGPVRAALAIPIGGGSPIATAGIVSAGIASESDPTEGFTTRIRRAATGDTAVDRSRAARGREDDMLRNLELMREALNRSRDATGEGERILHATINVGGERVQESMLRLERGSRATRGLPVETDR